MNRSLHNLLAAVEYKPHQDTVFLVGDILAKSTEAGSLAILDFLVRQNCCAKGVGDAPRPSGSPARDSHAKPAPCKPVYAVRGNHDQMIVQWRAWRDWFEGLQLSFPSAHLYPPRRRSGSLSALAASLASATTTTASYDAGPPVGTGEQFLALIEAEWLRDRADDPSGAGSDAEEWVDVARKRARGTWRAEWWRRIPQPGKGRTSKDWIMFGDHYYIARDMKPEHAELLYSLPLVIHVPSEHFFLVHGGLLPLDPRKPSDDKHQPLAHPPSPDDEEEVEDEDDYDYEYPTIDSGSSQHVFPRAEPHGEGHDNGDEVEELRVLQERSLLEDIPHNRDPWVVLNMRGVRKKGKVTRRGDKGTPWAKIWNGEMKRCTGFTGSARDVPAAEHSPGEDEDTEGDGGVDGHALPCYPSTVVYGHAASRDLDVRRWTVGLDTGCLYGRRLTGLVLTRPRTDAGGPTRTSPLYVDADDDADEEDDDEEESSDEEEDELDETAPEGHLRDMNSRFARVAGGSAIARARPRARRAKTWTRTIRFGDRDSGVEARLVSVKCPKVGDLS
ncbi:hypothetical protein BD309DRAFT_993675 [Dichomitus squalens]|nr:hypothetical protein BD309DRAFT_993675 [Dichomitus squalens]